MDGSLHLADRLLMAIPIPGSDFGNGAELCFPHNLRVVGVDTFHAEFIQG